MTNLFQVIEFEHSVEVHPVCEKDIDQAEPLSWNEAQDLALRTLQRKLMTHNEHYDDWEDPKDLEIINKLQESQSILSTSSKEEYLDNIFFS